MENPEFICIANVIAKRTEKTTSYRSFATTLSQLKMCDFSGETSKGFEVL